MNENISIVPMAEEDLDEIIQIGTSTKQLQIDDSEDMYYSKDQLKKAIHSQAEICLVAKEGSTLAGFFIAHINLVFDEVYISDIALKKDFRGRGIGKSLFEKAREILKEKHIDWSWALVQEENETMHQFLEKQGYLKGKKFYFFYRPVGF